VAKPLILYSSKSSLWKVADFGLGSSNPNRPSRYASETQSYGAPELMESDGDPAMHNKVIRAMGCVLAANILAFETDFAVLSAYVHSSTIN
jgi:serine/threonine protein kinase